MKHLVFLSGPRKGSRVRIEREALSIGRDRTNEVVIDDINLSRRHAEIFLREGTCHIRDLDTTNGTFVNGVRIEDGVALSPGDQVAIGDSVFIIEERKTQTHTRVVSFYEGTPEEEKGQIRLDPRKSHYLDPSKVSDRPAAAEHLARLYLFISGIAPILSPDRLLAELLDRALDASHADRGFIMLGNEEGRLEPAELRLRDPNADADDIHVSRLMTQQVLSTGQSVLSSDTLHDGRFKDGVASTGTHMNSLICAPIKSQEKVLGLLYVDTIGTTSPLGEQDLELLTAMALLTGSQFANAKLYEDLLDAMERTQSILRCLRSGVIVTDLDGKVREANRSARRLLGLTKTDIIGRALPDFKTFRSLWNVMDDTKRSGLPAERREVVITVAGAEVPVGVSTSLLRDHENRVRGIVATFQNLSVIRKLEHQVRMAQHLAALGQMAAGIAHEIRNPLNSIRGFAQLLEEMLPETSGAGEPPQGRSYTRIIIEEVDRMNQLVQDLLDFSRQHELTMTEMSVGEIVEDVLKELAPEIDEARIQVETKIEPGLASVMANSDKMKQVLVNVVRNAIEAMIPPVAPEGRPRRLKVSVRPAGGEGRPAVVETEISDTGLGMDDETLARAFEPFFTTRDRGTGLGLAICRKIVQQHGGRIEAESRLGAGTTFRITLPLE